VKMSLACKIETVRKSPVSAGGVYALMGLILTGCLAVNAAASPKKKLPPMGNRGEWGVSVVSRTDPDYAFQGEYEGVEDGETIGVQVIALGKGFFQAVFYPGGLPGAGYVGKDRFAVDGKRVDDRVIFTASKHTKTYLAKSPAEFSAVANNPRSQKGYSASLRQGVLEGTTDTGASFVCRKVVRTSPTLAMPPPEGARPLLAYTPGEAPDISDWDNPDWKALPDGSMLVVTPPPKEKRWRHRSVHAYAFGARSFHLHVEFQTPWMPGDRGQGRGNSGCFPPPGREFQILDSFGLEGKPNEAGGVYKDLPPSVNMCFPPLAWQTYDIHFTAPTDAPDGTAFYKALHNGTVIHSKVVLDKPGSPQGLWFQDHLNRVRFRNVWLLEKLSPL
jgi:hypothetical protein